MTVPRDADAPETPYALRFRVREGCLRAEASGRIDTFAEMLAFFREIGAELRRSAADSLLILDGTRSFVPDAQGFEALAAALGEDGFRQVRTAFVDVAGTSIDRIEVGEIVARTHGYALRVFDNEQAASIWLRYGND